MLHCFSIEHEDLKSWEKEEYRYISEMNVSSYIGVHSFVLIDEQKQKFTGWKYRSIPVKYKPTVTNASSIVHVQANTKSS